MNKDNVLCKDCGYMGFNYKADWRCGCPDAPPRDFLAGVKDCSIINCDGKCPFFVLKKAPPEKKGEVMGTKSITVEIEKNKINIDARLESKKGDKYHPIIDLKICINEETIFAAYVKDAGKMCQKMEPASITLKRKDLPGKYRRFMYAISGEEINGLVDSFMLSREDGDIYLDGYLQEDNLGKQIRIHVNKLMDEVIDDYNNKYFQISK